MGIVVSELLVHRLELSANLNFPLLEELSSCKLAQAPNASSPPDNSQNFSRNLSRNFSRARQSLNHDPPCHQHRIENSLLPHYFPNDSPLDAQRRKPTTIQYRIFDNSSAPWFSGSRKSEAQIPLSAARNRARQRYRGSYPATRNVVLGLAFLNPDSPSRTRVYHHQAQLQLKKSIILPPRKKNLLECFISGRGVENDSCASEPQQL